VFRATFFANRYFNCDHFLGLGNMKRKFAVYVVLSLIWSASSPASTVGATASCPHSKLESCRWEITAQTRGFSASPEFVVTWEKAVLSRHREKPLANALTCNVDRSFVDEVGYIHVWLDGSKEPCDPTKTDPKECGVTFLLEDPKDPYSAQGFKVKAPVGKKLKKVEHFSALHLQCGDFAKKDFARYRWDSKVGWRRSGGIYTSNKPITVDTAKE
jgi:hypothetical protein